MAIMCSSFADMMGLVAIARHGIPNLGSCDRTITPKHSKSTEWMKSNRIKVLGFMEFKNTYVQYIMLGKKGVTDHTAKC